MASFNFNAVGSGAGGVVSTVLYVVIFCLVMTILTWLILLYMSRMRFNHECFIYSRTKTGYHVRRLKGGLIKDRKSGKYEFRILKPRYRVNNFERDWVLSREIKTMSGSRWKNQVYLWQDSDNKVIQLNPQFFEDLQAKKHLVFSPRQLGKKDFEEEFDRHTERMWDITSWLDKHGALIAWGGIVMTLVLINLITLNKLVG